MWIINVHNLINLILKNSHHNHYDEHITTTKNFLKNKLSVKTRPLRMLSTRDSIRLKDTQTESKRMEKAISWGWNQRKAGVTIPKPDKIDFKMKAVTRDKKGLNNSTSEIYAKKTKALHRKGIFTMYSLQNICNNPDMETTYMSMNRWMDKVLHICSGILAIKRNEILPSTTT